VRGHEDLTLTLPLAPTLTQALRTKLVSERDIVAAKERLAPTLTLTLTLSPTVTLTLTATLTVILIPTLSLTLTSTRSARGWS